MFPCKFLWKPIIKKAVTGRFQPFVMYKGMPAWPGALTDLGLYLHVPFCQNLCAYCPYNRIKYDAALFSGYEQAVKAEIDLYAPHLKGQEFVSLYIGGGTPTVNVDGLARILEHLDAALNFNCPSCIELHPASMDDNCLRVLKSLGIKLISIGVESTSDKVLKAIGRSHDGDTAISAVKRALAMGFESVNVDLMFALPEQDQLQWQKDVTSMVELGVDQISTYPLFQFPYSDLGQQNRIREICRPPHHTIRSMLNFTHEYCEQHGLKRCAVWSWLRDKKHKFSSITRHHYVGFGPSAASMTGTDFYVNTFDVMAYSATLPSFRPVALTMPVDRRIEMAYWLYWRVYELKILNSDFQRLFGPATSLAAEFGKVLYPPTLIGLMERHGDDYYITKAGAYWIHRLQNEYSLNYINRLWGTCRKVPWPETVSF
jgi:oxygen-independent coproporphyrinogen III oxidase